MTRVVTSYIAEWTASLTTDNCISIQTNTSVSLRSRLPLIYLPIAFLPATSSSSLGKLKIMFSFPPPPWYLCIYMYTCVFFTSCTSDPVSERITNWIEFPLFLSTTIKTIRINSLLFKLVFSLIRLKQFFLMLELQDELWLDEILKIGGGVFLHKLLPSYYILVHINFYEVI